MIEAETVFGDGDAQLLAYMSIIQADRKKRGQPDWTVYGVLSDGETFVFYDLDMNGQYTVVYLQVQREGWQMVANMLGSLIIEGIKTCSSPVRSSLASNPSPRNSRQQISPQLPPLGTLPSIEDMMEMDKIGNILNLLKNWRQLAIQVIGNGRVPERTIERIGTAMHRNGLLMGFDERPLMGWAWAHLWAILHYMHKLLDFSTFK
ncbi:hypothetical protein ACN38_g7078 [Penicillium nordicum]|uniref:Uncharacterized protein n=1 Tax=Penicillium nordicum TaxID=229535 RepID=A0A0M8P2A2_9EURO|nr:hypothetical protein ACN38_g7078 [Penicillium nordicum]